jgi:hypothetical protein
VATTDWPYWQQVPATVTYGGCCPHGTPVGSTGICFQCQNPAMYSPSSPLYPSYQLGGWRCPGCQRVWSPAVTQCLPCAPAVAVAVTSAEPVSDLCQPSQEGSMCGCDDSEDEGTCTGGRHCSC